MMKEIMVKYYHSYVEPLERDYDALVAQNKLLQREISRLKNKLSGYSKSVLEQDNERLRAQCSKYLKERNEYQMMYANLKKTVR